MPVSVRVSVCVPLAAVRLPPFSHRRQPPILTRRGSSGSGPCSRGSSGAKASAARQELKILSAWRRSPAGPSAPRRWMAGCPVANSTPRASARSSPRATPILRLLLSLPFCWLPAVSAWAALTTGRLLLYRQRGRLASWCGAGLRDSPARAAGSMAQASRISASILRGSCGSRRRRQPKLSGRWKRASHRRRRP